MAFNFSVLRVRVLSSIVFVLVMLTGLLWNNVTFFILFTVIALGCLWEYQKLVGLIDPVYKNKSTLHTWGLMAVAVLLMITISHKIISISPDTIKMIGYVLIPILVVMILAADFFSNKLNIKNIGISLMGIVYIPMGLCLFFQIKGMPSNAYFEHANFYIPLFIVVSVWINDTMAYLVGSMIGRHSITPVSPNKTWEGTIGGILLSLFLVCLTANFFLPGVQTSFVFWICFVASVAGNYGDFMESKIKRIAGVKDSGRMMPGHGGFLDRFDSILLAVPFVWILLRFFY